MAIDFPIDPSLTPSYQYTYNGITQNWNWGFSGGSGVSAWLATGFTITSGGQAVSSIYDLTNVTGQNYGFGALNNYIVFKYDHVTSNWTPDFITLNDLNQVDVSSTTQNDVLTIQSGIWRSAPIPSVIFGQVTGGGVGMTKAPKLAIVSGDSSVTITGITSDAGITISITAGAGGGGANPEGPEGSVQFADGSSLSGVAEARIVTMNNINNPRGFSGNFVYYTESTTADSSIKSTETTISVPFGTRNIYIVDNISLNAGVTLTVGGFSPITGSSMTLVLGYTGESSSRILFPGNQGIYWAEGPFGVTTGSDAVIFTRPSPKTFDILYFFSDGSRIYGNRQTNFIQSR